VGCLFNVSAARNVRLSTSTAFMDRRATPHVGRTLEQVWVPFAPEWLGVVNLNVVFGQQLFHVAV
jgi:hypothetical protein